MRRKAISAIAKAAIAKAAIAKSIPILALVLALGAGNLALASGSYTGRPPRPPASIDRGMYELGKKVFAGEFAPAVASNATVKKPASKFSDTPPTGSFSTFAQNSLAKIETLETANSERRARRVGADKGS